MFARDELCVGIGGGGDGGGGSAGRVESGGCIT